VSESEMSTLAYVLFAGVGATAIMDLWSLARRRLLQAPLPNYALVGRWIAYMAGGRVLHESIAAASPMHGERAIGWTAHYLIGIAFACLLPVVWGVAWFRTPSLPPALIVGIVTVLAPFLVMQPAMGLGVAASRTPHPGVARLQSLITHTIFGLGLYAVALLIARLSPGD
jgi:fatty acid desaturase